MASRRNKPTVTALIDGDIFIYQAAAASERPIQWDEDLWTLHSSLSDAVQYFEDKLASALENIAQFHKAEVKPLIALSDPTGRYFRKDIWPAYKANRKTKRSPLVRRALFDYVTEKYETYTRPGLEGDDVLGILQTSPYIVKGEKVTVSSDKDFKTIPGKHYNMDKEEFMTVRPAGAAYFHMVQTLMGDSSDGYPGCPGVGPKKAESLLEAAVTGLLIDECASPEAVYWEAWPVVAKAYERAGLSQDYALTMARLARICQRDDYDFKKKEVIPWTPPIPSTITTQVPQ